MLQNKTFFPSLLLFIFSTFFLVILLFGLAYANNKIGLDLEWRPITGVRKPPPPRLETSRLYVEAVPEDARVRILNIGPVFRQGMELDPGRYHVEASAKGYVSQDLWVSLEAGKDERLSFRLERLPTVQPPSKPTPAGGERVKTFTVNGAAFKMMRIPAGEFMMGSPSGEPGRDGDEKQHRVRISKPFFLGETEVTQGLWRAVMGNNPSYFKNCGDDCPVEMVSWKDCQEFIRKLNRLVSGGGFRLPTEAEWEYACRAGTKGAYAGNLDAMAWYGNNSGNSRIDALAIWKNDKKSYVKKILENGCRTHPVAGKRSNAWGLYDMHGNVWERCQDWYGDYPTGSVADPTGISSGSDRVLRGGCWLHYARNCRSAYRDGLGPALRFRDIGFRLARF